MNKEEALAFFEDPNVNVDSNGYYTEEEEIEAVCMAISVLKGEWIPVSERLPEVGHVVYCQLTDGSHVILFLDDDYGQKYWVGRSNRKNYDVIAWRELPEPYKKGEKKNGQND